MPLIRALARPLLASTFVMGGIETLRNPDPKVPEAKEVIGDVHEKLPALSNTKQVVQADAAVKVVAGALLALGKFPRLSSLVLAASLAPTTLAGHRFWEESDPDARKAQQYHFFKNVSLLGGLIIAAVDTEGRPSLGYRAKKATAAATQSAGDFGHDAAARLAPARDVVASTRDAVVSAIESTRDAAVSAKDAAADRLPG